MNNPAARLLSFDPALFDPAQADADALALNADILQKLSSGPDQWSLPPEVVRERRRQGLGAFPLSPRSPQARVIEIAGPAGPLALRIIQPETVRGVYLHIHGGGWVFGAADFQDNRYERLARNCGLATVSVEYRLAPEHPYPAAPDDCEAAALWLARECMGRFGTDALFIGGDSAGAHLSVCTLLRLRDRHGRTPFRAANLFNGVFDLAMTPSVRNWGSEKLVLNTHDIWMFTRHYLRSGGDVRDPDVSPLMADLKGLPPAIFSIGTRDPLVDDTLFMASRYAAAGSDTDLAIYPGGCHSFINFEFPMADKALTRIEQFFHKCL